MTEVGAREFGMMRRVLRKQVAQNAADRLLARGMIGAPPAPRVPSAPPDLPGPSVGLERGVACGCHAPKCTTCHQTGGCGWSGCGWCLEYGYVQGLDRRGVASSRRRDIAGGLQGGGGSQSGLGPPPGASTGLGVLAASLPGAVDFYDVHSHNFQADDWPGDRAETDTRIDRLSALKRYGVQRIALSGMVSDPSDLVNTSAALNDLTLYARDRDPDLFVALCQVLARDLDKVEGITEVRARLADSHFKGIGELLVHAHHENTNESAVTYDHFVAIFEEAVAADIPVQVHWDVGNTESEPDPAKLRTPTQNRDQLLALLDEVGVASGIVAPPGRDSNRLKLVLAHCGAGPASTGGGDDPADFVGWGLFIWFLLAREDVDVYLEISGMQKGDPESEFSVRRLFVRSEGGDDVPTRMGAYILDLMTAFPTRFMVGLDADNQAEDDEFDTDGRVVEWGMSSYRESVVLYRDFLALGGLDDDTVDLILAGNAEALFEPARVDDASRIDIEPHVSWVPDSRLDERFSFDPGWLAGHLLVPDSGSWRVRW